MLNATAFKCNYVSGPPEMFYFLIRSMWPEIAIQLNHFLSNNISIEGIEHIKEMKGTHKYIHMYIHIAKVNLLKLPENIGSLVSYM